MIQPSLSSNDIFCLCKAPTVKALGLWRVLIRGGKKEPLDLKPSKILILISYTSSIMTICFPLGLI